MNLPRASSFNLSLIMLHGARFMLTRCYGAHFQLSQTASPRTEHTDYFTDAANHGLIKDCIKGRSFVCFFVKHYRCYLHIHYSQAFCLRVGWFWFVDSVLVFPCLPLPSLFWCCLVIAQTLPVCLTLLFGSLYFLYLCLTIIKIIFLLVEESVTRARILIHTYILTQILPVHISFKILFLLSS